MKTETILERAADYIASGRRSVGSMVEELIFSPWFPITEQEDVMILSADSDDLTVVAEIGGETYRLKAANAEVFQQFDSKWYRADGKDPAGAVNWLKDQAGTTTKRISGAPVAAGAEDVLTGLRGKG